ncbi:MAG: phosphoribosylglycinamide formyltransferase [Spirochaetaceae bacterium]|nr:phosphoribosylglycinamide formyltransferase [Spirochaetaceae bacterium]
MKILTCKTLLDVFTSCLPFEFGVYTDTYNYDGPRRTAVLVSGGGTNLQAIIDAKGRRELPHAEIALVVSSDRNAFALERAKKAGITCSVLDETDYTDNNGVFDGVKYDQDLAAVLQSNRIEIVVLAGFLVILGSGVLNLYRDRIINVHPSLIPSFCGEGFYGLFVHEAALARGVKVTGATVHFVNEITDGGKIIMQKAVEVVRGDTPGTLQRRVMEQAEWIILPEALEALCAGRLE